MNELKRITTHFHYSKNIDKLYQNKETSNLLIACLNKKKNFYDTTRYSKYSEEILASVSWRNLANSNGDHFTINPASKLPAWINVKKEFKDLNLQSELISAMSKLGFIKPTAIQVSSIPIISSGYNTIIGGETGCGKTLAFILPILNELLGRAHQPDEDVSPSSIIIAPTWELCNQLNRVITSLSEQLNLKNVLFLHKKDLEGRIDVMVSTPHTLMEAINLNSIKLKNLTKIVMDEADMLLDASFQDTIRNVLSNTSIQTVRPTDGTSIGTQLILCNATSPNDIEESFGTVVPLDTFEIVKTNDMHHLIPSVAHKFIRCSSNDKPAQLISLIKCKGVQQYPYTIVFCNNIDNVMKLSSILKENQIEHRALHKGLQMKERVNNFDDFQFGPARILLSTDLASRGLDTMKARHIINYDFPRFISDYIHRAGRTGRVGGTGGKVTNLISSKLEVSAVQYIEMATRQRVKLMSIDTSRYKVPITNTNE